MTGPLVVALIRPGAWGWACRECGRTIAGYETPGYAADRARNHWQHRHPACPYPDAYHGCGWHWYSGDMAVGLADALGWHLGRRR